MKLRTKLKIAAAITTLVLFAALILPAVTPRHVERYDIVESLVAPVCVDGWDRDGLNLVDGRHVRLPEVVRLPDKSEGLRLATREGVELSADGRIIGLIPVRPWCGSDPVRYRLMRVDLATFLIYLGEAAASSSQAATYPKSTRRDAGIIFSEYGWNFSDFLGFQTWREPSLADRI